MGDTSNPVAPRAQDHTPPPDRVADGARSCILYVEKSIGVTLDYTTETLPILDHYLRTAGAPGANQPETTLLLATVAGCYLGEVIRSRHPLQWDLGQQDPMHWSLTSHDANITVFPIAIAHIAVEGIAAERQVEAFQLEGKLKKALARRLANLPAVSDEEYVAPSTRVEVIDIAFDLLSGDTRPLQPEDDDSGHVHDASCEHEHHEDNGAS